MLASSWQRWTGAFEEAGYTTVTADWPDDPDTVAEAAEHPEVFAHKGVGDIADHIEAVIGTLRPSPPWSATPSAAC